MENFIQAAILISGIAGQLCMYKRSYKGFIWFLFSNVLLIYVAFVNAMWGMLLLYCFFSFMCLISIWNWRKMDKAAAQAQPADTKFSTIGS
jgi:nicotinamide riboside transporter PnuC